MSIQYVDLARQQGTRLAVLPVHTPEEKAFYQMLIQRTTGHFSGASPPDWSAMAQEWSAHSNSTKIFYKVRMLVLPLAISSTSRSSHTTTTSGSSRST